MLPGRERPLGHLVDGGSDPRAVVAQHVADRAAELVVEGRRELADVPAAELEADLVGDLVELVRRGEVVRGVELAVVGLPGLDPEWRIVGGLLGTPRNDREEWVVVAAEAGAADDGAEPSTEEARLHAGDRAQIAELLRLEDHVVVLGGCGALDPDQEALVERAAYAAAEAAVSLRLEEGSSELGVLLEHHLEVSLQAGFGLRLLTGEQRFHERVAVREEGVWIAREALPCAIDEGRNGALGRRIFERRLVARE